MADPQIAQWFYTVDKNKTGKLSAVELQQALRNNNYTTFDIQVVQVSFRVKKSHFWQFLVVFPLSFDHILTLKSVLSLILEFSKYYFE